MYRITALMADGSTQVLYDPVGSGVQNILAPRLAQELNQAGDLEYSLLWNHPLFNSLKPMETYISAELDGDEIFYGRVLTQKPSPLTGMDNCHCEGALAFLLDSELPPDEKSKGGKSYVHQTQTAAEFLARCIAAHNAEVSDSRRQFAVGTISHSRSQESKEYQITSYTQTRSAIETHIISKYGGYLQVRKVGSQHVIDWLEDGGRTNASTIELGENVISQENTLSGENLYTVIRPVGKNGLLLEGTQTMDIYTGSDLSRYGRIVRTIQFPDAKDDAALRQAAQNFINRLHRTLYIQSNISLLDLHFVDGSESTIKMGDAFTNIRLLEGTRLIVANRSWDFDHPENDSITLKNAKELEPSNLDGSGEGKGGGTLSKQTGKNGEGNKQNFKYIHEFDDKLQLQADEIDILGDTVKIHADDLQITANTLSSISHDIGDLGNEIDGIKGTGVFQDSDKIVQVAGLFKARKGEDGKWILELIDGAQFSVEKDGVRSFVTSERELNSFIEQTSSQIRSAVWTANSVMYSEIIQTASMIRQELGDVENDLHSTIEQTADGIRTDVYAANSAIYSHIEQTATNIRSVIADTENDLHSEIEQTKSMIRSAVWTANSEIYSEIRQTASMIRAEVGDIQNDLEASIETTAEGIRSEVHASNSNLYSYVQQTATNIHTEIVNVESGLKYYVDETAQGIREIIQSTPQTFIQYGDPTDDEGTEVPEKAVWVKTNEILSWEDVATNSWETLGEYSWADYYGSKIYVRKNGEWVLASDDQLSEINRTHIDKTDDHIAMVAESVDGHYAEFVIEKDEIRGHVQNVAEDLGTEIKQTASMIRSEAHAANSQLYSVIEQTATNIRHEVADVANNLGSTIEQTAERIRSDVYAANSQIYSTIEQTATHIRSEVRDIQNDLGSSIKQTANNIRSDVYAANSQVYSYINQTATSIELTVASVGSRVGTIEGSKIWQTKDDITNVVGTFKYKYERYWDPTTGTYKYRRVVNVIDGAQFRVTRNGVESLVVDGGNVKSMINQSGETILIQASKINLSGYVTADELRAVKANFDNLTSGYTTASWLKASSLSVTGNLYVKNNTVFWFEQQVCTDVSVSRTSSKSWKLGNDTTWTGALVEKCVPTYKTIYYLGHS